MYRIIFFSGEGQPLPTGQPPPLDGNPVTVAVQCYEDNCHYVALIPIKCDLAQRAYEYNNM